MNSCTFLAILLCSVAVVDSAATPSTDNQKFIGIVNGLNVIAGQLIESVKNSLGELSVQTQNWIQNVTEEVESFIANSIYTFDQYIEEMQQQINEEIEPCLEDACEKIKNVKAEASGTIDACRSEGYLKLSTIREDIENYRQLNQKTFEGMVTFIQSCHEQPSFGDKIKCAVDASRNISSSVTVFQENVHNTTISVGETIRSSAEETHECIWAAVADAKSRIQIIIEEARQCLQDATSTTNTEANGAAADNFILAMK